MRNGRGLRKRLGHPARHRFGIIAVRLGIVDVLTATLQAVVVVLSGSVALLGDTLHNVADALTAVPLLIAFTLARRPATTRFTYGYGRAEDLAGLVVLAMISLSSVLAAWAAIDRLLHPQRIDHLAVVAAAGLVGFVGNEIVARYRIRVGNQIGSASTKRDGSAAVTLPGSDGPRRTGMCLGREQRCDDTRGGRPRSVAGGPPAPRRAPRSRFVRRSRRFRRFPCSRRRWWSWPPCRPARGHRNLRQDRHP